MAEDDAPLLTEFVGIPVFTEAQARALGEQRDVPTFDPPKCPTICDDDCTAECHEVHGAQWKREHSPINCPGRSLRTPPGVAQR